MLAQFFQIGSLPENQIIGQYNLSIVLLSCLVAVFASYVALDITGRLRDIDNTPLSITWWLLGGAFAMGAGIWSMHFIGMLAFNAQMLISYDPLWTGFSMIIAILASLFALFLLKSKKAKTHRLALGGIILGLAIVTMHYSGMEAMKITMNIHYLPGLFLLSVLIAILASEVALWLAIQSNRESTTSNVKLKVISAIVMGIAICGMHYTGMAAAIFTHKDIPLSNPSIASIDPSSLSIFIATVTFIILGIAFAVSTYKKALNQNISIARRAGMAEVAENVLHNVGNVLNSVNVSVTLVSEKLDQFEFKRLADISQLIHEHQHNLDAFIKEDSKGSKLMEYMSTLSEHWQKEKILISKEIEELANNIQHIKDVISAQQALSGISGLEHTVAIDAVVEEALLIAETNFSQKGIAIKKNYSSLMPVLVDKIKLMQILVNLLRNAKDSLIVTPSQEKLISIRTLHKGKKFFIQISDNGLGIKSSDIKRIFTHGFTTKKSGHGYGLHASAIAAKEMGGALKVESKGPGTGATFILELPYKQMRK